jgi:hypothetical protein
MRKRGRRRERVHLRPQGNDDDGHEDAHHDLADVGGLAPVHLSITERLSVVTPTGVAAVATEGRAAQVCLRWEMTSAYDVPCRRARREGSG